VAAQRQHTGTAGRTENAQVAVYLAYAAPAGTAFIDWAWYLPRSWTSDPGRCRAAGVPQSAAFAAKPALVRQMITRAIDAGTGAAWAAADGVYVQDPALRAGLARRGLGCVLAVTKSHPVTTGMGTRPAVELAKRLPAGAWQRLSAGRGGLLSVLAAAQPDGDHPHDDQLIPLTRHEIRGLFTGLHQQPTAPGKQLHWLRWRRRHQSAAKASHYRPRALAPT